MNEGQRLYLQQIIDARPAGVRQLFADYGITVEPTPDTLQTAFSVFGKPFIGELVNAVIPRYDSAEGDALQANAAQADQKKTFFENIEGVLTGAASVLTAWGTATGKNGTGGITPASVVIQQPATEKNSTLLFLGIGMLAVILLSVIIIVRKK